MNCICAKYEERKVIKFPSNLAFDHSIKDDKTFMLVCLNCGRKPPGDK